MGSLRVSMLLSLALLVAVAACSTAPAATALAPTVAAPTQSAPTVTPTPLIAATIEATAEATAAATDAALISTREATAEAASTAESTASAQLYLIRQPIPGPACSISPTGGQGVNIRRDPTRQSAAIGGLLRGAWVLAKGLDASAGWFQISAPNTPVDGGWITGQSVAIRGVCNCTPGGTCERGAPLPTARP